MRLANLCHTVDGRRLLAFVVDGSTFYPVAEVLRSLGEVLQPELLDARSNLWLAPGSLETLSRVASRIGDVEVAALDGASWRLGPPVANPGKIIAAGRNYLDHVREGQEIWAKRGRKVEVPTFPTAFMKFPSSLIGAHDDIRIPEGIDDVDYEIELAVIIGKHALDIDVSEAMNHVAGYAICNDLAARGIQRREMESQIGITLAKNFPTFAPMGPWLTPSHCVPDPQALMLELEVDGDLRQRASTSDMMFPVAELIAYWSRTGLEPGDILITGTPAGVALARERPEDYYLRPGQLVVARIEGLGELRNGVTQSEESVGQTKASPPPPRP